MKDNKIKKIILGGVVIAIVLGSGIDGYRASVVALPQKAKSGVL